MRILLVSDIHSNWPALQAVRESCDLCLFLGDLVDYGGEPGPCVEWARRHATHAIRGNHDHGVAQDVDVSGGVGFKYLSRVTRPLTRARLDSNGLRYLADLPVTQSLTLDGRRFLLVHATPRDPLDEFAPPDEAFWSRRLMGVDADVVCVGHTHYQYALQINGTLVINPGSVGLQRDGDPRAAYAVLDDRRVDFRRVEYPIEDAVRSVEDSPLPEKAKAMLAAVYRNGELPKNGQ
jgi:putative phosphoesterase